MTYYITCQLRDGTHVVARSLDPATGRYSEVASSVSQATADRIATLLRRHSLTDEARPVATTVEVL